MGLGPAGRVAVLCAVALAAVLAACTAPAGGSGAAGQASRSAAGAAVDPGTGTAAGGMPGGPAQPTAPARSTAPAPVDAQAVQSGQVRAAVVGLLAQRSAALATGDRSAWLATVDDPASPAGVEEMAAYDALQRLGVTRLQALGGAGSAGSPPVPTPLSGPPGPTPLSGPTAPTPLARNAGPTGDGAGSTAALGRAVTVGMSLGYRIDGFDRGDRVVSRTITVVARPGGWRIVRWLGPGDVPEVFDLAGLVVARTDRVLVAGPVSLGRLLERVADAEFAQGVLASALGRAAPTVVIDPGDGRRAAALLGRASPADPTGAGQIAATTIGPRAAGEPAPADRVVLDPDANARLTEAGRRQVLAHEFTHVLIRATTRQDLPLWLSEGMAEWVGYSWVDLPADRIAAHLLALVRAQGSPLSLPAEADFGGADPATAYQQAWLAVSRLARRLGPGGLVALVYAVGGSADPAAPTQGEPARPVEAVLAERLGQSPADFVAAWRAELVARARS